MSTGVDRKANPRRAGALERGHGAPREALAQLGDALGGVGAVPITVEAAELVVAQAANGEEVVSVGADTKANTWAWWQESGHYPAAAGKQAGLCVLSGWSLRHT